MTRKKETINWEGTNAPLSVQRLVNAIAIGNPNNPSCVSTSATPPPPPPDISSSDLCCRCHHRNDGCIASRCDDTFIVGNSNISLKGGGGEGEDLVTNNSWDPSSPSYCPPSLRTDPLLFRRWLRPLPQRRQRILPPLSLDGRCHPDRTTLPPPPPAVVHLEGERCDLCWCNINEVYGTYKLQWYMLACDTLTDSV